MRSRAAEEEKVVRTHEAEAAEREAAARQARAESDRKAAEADKLQMQAEERGERASVKRGEHRDWLRAADDLDPDVPEEGRTDSGADGDGHRRHDGLGGGAREDRGTATGYRDGPGSISPADRLHHDRALNTGRSHHGCRSAQPRFHGELTGESLHGHDGGG